MCCRFYLPGETNPEYNEIIEKIKNPNALIKTSGDIFPTDTVPVIANDKNMHPAVFGMKWGYSEFGKLIFNARSESAATSKLYGDGFNIRRCLIPAQCYYEWDKQKQKYKIGAANSDIIYLAGVYRLEGKTPVFSILTKNPVSSIISSIHKGFDFGVYIFVIETHLTEIIIFHYLKHFLPVCIPWV